MRLSRSLVPLLLPLALVQCSGLLAPYATVPATLNKVQQPTPAPGETVPTQIGVCYNALTTTADQVRIIAAQNCDPGSVPRAIERDLSLTNCPLFLPARATFACMAKAP